MLLRLAAALTAVWWALIAGGQQLGGAFSGGVIAYEGQDQTRNFDLYLLDVRQRIDVQGAWG